LSNGGKASANEPSDLGGKASANEPSDTAAKHPPTNDGGKTSANEPSDHGGKASAKKLARTHLVAKHLPERELCAFFSHKLWNVLNKILLPLRLVWFGVAKLQLLLVSEMPIGVTKL
jgi:hypothetical protein